MSRRPLGGAALMLLLGAATWSACAVPQQSCLAGLVACDGACVDLQSEPGHCGACGRGCGAGYSPTPRHAPASSPSSIH